MSSTNKEYLPNWNDRLSEELAEGYIRRELWGYPALVKKFFDDVRPALVEAREKRRREREIEERQNTITEHADNVSLHHGPEVVVQDKDTASVSIQSNQPATLNKGPGPSDETHTDTQQDTESQADDPLRTTDEHLPLAVSGNTGALETTSGDPIQQVPAIQDEATAPNAMEEVPSMSEDNIERLHIGQTEKDEGE